MQSADAFVVSDDITKCLTAEGQMTPQFYCACRWSIGQFSVLLLLQLYVCINLINFLNAY